MPVQKQMQVECILEYVKLVYSKRFQKTQVEHKRSEAFAYQPS